MSSTPRSSLTSRRDESNAREEQREPVLRQNSSERTYNTSELESFARPSTELRQQALMRRQEARAKLDSNVLCDRPQLLSDDNTIRLILLGITGGGKSSVGNLLLGLSDGDEEFKSDISDESVTEYCAVGRSTFNGKNLVVVDTPGFLDTKAKTREQKRTKVKEITKSIQKTVPGPHAFIVVLKPTRMTPDELKGIALAKRIFKTDISQHCVVVFPRKDELVRGKKTIDQFLSTPNNEAKKFVDECGNGYVAVDNVGSNKSERENMRQEVLQLVMNMMEKNGNTYFTNKLLDNVNERIKINKESVGRWGAFGIDSAATTKTTIEIVRDEEIIPEIEAIVEEHVLPLLDEN